MKKRILYPVTVLAALLLLSACAASPEVKQRQARASRNLGEMYLMQGKHAAALNEFLKAEKLDPADPYLQYDIGLVYMAMEKSTLAVAQFKKTIQLKPDMAAAKNSLGAVYLVQEEWNLAIAVFDEVLKNLLYPTPHLPLSNLGFAYYEKKLYAKSEKYYRAALKKEPEYVNAWRGLGRVHQATGRMPEAVQAFERAAALAPESAQLQSDLADAYRLSRHYEKAAATYQKVIELAPNGELAEKARAELNSLP